MTTQKKYENLKKLMIMVGILLFFIGLHDVDNATNIINVERMLCQAGIKDVRMDDSSVLFTLTPKKLYMIGMFLMLIGFIIVLSTALFL